MKPHSTVESLYVMCTLCVDSIVCTLSDTTNPRKKRTQELSRKGEEGSENRRQDQGRLGEIKGEWGSKGHWDQDLYYDQMCER